MEKISKKEMQTFFLTRRREVLFTLEECTSFGGKKVKTTKVKMVDGEGTEACFLHKKRNVHQFVLRACFKRKLF